MGRKLRSASDEIGIGEAGSLDTLEETGALGFVVAGPTRTRQKVRPCTSPVTTRAGSPSASKAAAAPAAFASMLKMPIWM